MPLPESTMAHTRTPAASGWRGYWIVAAVFFCGSLALLEITWRVLDFSPSITDDKALWAGQRARVETVGPETLLILGRSRIHQGFVPEAFAELAPDHDYIQLAMGANHPMATLRDVAENTPFAGTVLVSCTAPSFMPELWEQQAAHLDFYHREWGPWKRFIRNTRTAFERRLTLLLPDVMLQRIGTDLLRGQVPKQFLWTHPDRTQVVDYHRADLEAFTENQQATVEQNMANYASLPGYEEWPAYLPQVFDWTRTIAARGGKVVFLRMPTSGAYRATEEAHFPREKYWDVMAASSPAATLHFEDHPALAEMVCAEGAHLHRKDAVNFTHVLTEELLRRDLLRGRERTS